MATNPYINKVVYDGTTLMDITDTTATASDVATGKDIYLADGSKVSGTGSLLTDIVWKEPIVLTFSESTAQEGELSYVEAINYPFFKLVGFTKRKSAGDYTGNNYVYFYATNPELPSINAQYGVRNRYQLVNPTGGSYTNDLSICTDLVLDTMAQSGHEGQLYLRLNRINSNYSQYYGGDFIYWIDKNRCSQDSIFYNLPYVRSSESL